MVVYKVTIFQFNLATLSNKGEVTDFRVIIMLYVKEKR